MAVIDDENCRARLLMTVPGISHIMAIAMMEEMADITRSATAGNLVSYAGLVLSRGDGADRHLGGGMTRQGSVWLRQVVGNTATAPIRHDPRLGPVCERVSRRGWQKAKVAAARRLVEIAWHIPVTGKEYRTQNAELTQSTGG